MQVTDGSYTADVVGLYQGSAGNDTTVVYPLSVRTTLAIHPPPTYGVMIIPVQSAIMPVIGPALPGPEVTRARP